MKTAFSQPGALAERVARLWASAWSEKSDPALEMSVQQYAKHRGWHDSYIRRLRQAGILVMGPVGKIDWKCSDVVLASRKLRKVHKRSLAISCARLPNEPTPTQINSIPFACTVRDAFSLVRAVLDDIPEEAQRRHMQQAADLAESLLEILGDTSEPTIHAASNRTTFAGASA